MPFHKSRLGSYGNSLPCDRSGYVPEEGDTKSKFDFGGEDVDDEWFEEFKAEAIRRTDEACSALTEWRQSNG